MGVLESEPRTSVRAASALTTEQSLQPGLFIYFSAVLEGREWKRRMTVTPSVPEERLLTPSPSLLECSLASKERMTTMSHTHEFVGDITKYSENMSDSENG